MLKWRQKALALLCGLWVAFDSIATNATLTRNTAYFGSGAAYRELYTNSIPSVCWAWHTHAAAVLSAVQHTLHYCSLIWLYIPLHPSSHSNIILVAIVLSFVTLIFLYTVCMYCDTFLPVIGLFLPFQRFQKRYFVLDQQRLMYYEKPTVSVFHGGTTADSNLWSPFPLSSATLSPALLSGCISFGWDCPGHGEWGFHGGRVSTIRTRSWGERVCPEHTKPDLPASSSNGRG